MSSEDEPASRPADAETLAGADIVVLLMVLVQLTGDATLLDEAAPHIVGPWDYNENLPEDLRRRIRTRLADVLSRIAQGRMPLAGPPPPDLMRRMMSTAVGAAVPDEYMPMLLEEMGFGPPGARDLNWRGDVAPPAREAFHVAIVGAGISGICAGIKLKAAGIPFTILEKNDAVGGTWHENVYPGCGVDTPNHFYSFSFAANHRWSHYFSKRDELFAYLRDCADEYGITPHIRFGHEVSEARWDEDRARWSLTARHAAGDLRLEAHALVFAVGQLNRPKIPAIPGLDCFAGPVVHTAAWDPALDIRNRHVALIGTGASGMQVGPSIAPEVERLAIFQRSPHWVASNPNYHRAVGAAKQAALETIPFYTNWYRFQLLWGSADGIYPSLRIDPDWHLPEQSLNQANEDRRQDLIAHIRAEIGDDPVLLDKVVPRFPPYGKRMLRDNNWYRTLKRPNVDLVTEPIARISPDVIVTADGVAHPADVIVLATGFQAARMLAPMEITGRDGIRLRDQWGEEDPRAYLGITVPNFPNMFVLFGPNTVLAHGGSAIFHTECQVRYTLRCLRELIETGSTAMEVRQDVHDRYNAEVDAIHERMVWSHKGMTNWYKNSRGRVVMTTPWRMVDYWRLTAEMEPADYRWSRARPHG